MKRLILALLVACAISGNLFGFDLSVPNEVIAYKNLEIVLTPDEGMELNQARFYFYQEGKTEPLYAVFANKEGVWKTTIPYKYFIGEELTYYTLVQTAQNKFIRYPQRGNGKARLLHDVKAPVLTLNKPDAMVLEKGKKQLVVFEVTDESQISEFEILYNGKFLTDAVVYKGKLAFFITTPGGRKDTEAKVTISIADIYNNKSREQYTFQLAKKKGEFFAAKGDIYASLDAEYELEMGKSANTTDLGTFFSDMQHEVMLDFVAGGKGYLKAGPLALDVLLEIADEVSVFDVFEAYPNTLIADYQNIMNLWHPWNFDNEFNYQGEVPRKFYNLNQMRARLSILDPILAYTFGDQKISFQAETLKDFDFRGSSLVLDTPILNLSIAKGLSDLGLYQEAWPQNFFGLQAGIGVFDYWFLQTNISFISSLQGRFDSIASTGISPIGVLYDLGDIKPEENLVFGLSTGTYNPLFNLSAGIGLTLYADDAGSILDKDQLASDINEGFGFDIAPYLGYIDTIQSIFPVFDYFPISEGLAVKAINRELWGLTYGADLEIPRIGVDGWFHTTDATYKSLGAAVDTDVMDIGGSWEMPIKDFDFLVKYNFQKGNIPDILFNDLLPLFLPELAPTANPTEYDISTLTHTGDIAISTPPSGIFSSVSLAYTFEFATTNSKKLADSIQNDNVAKTAILNSTSNDTTITHTAGLQVKSGRIKMGDVFLTLGAKTEDSFITYSLVDGASDGSSIWELGYALDSSLQFKRYRWNLGFKHDWSTAAASDVAFGYETKLTIQKMFFDTMSFKATFNQLFKTSNLQKYSIGCAVTLNKEIGILDTSANLNFGYIDSLVDDSYDAMSLTFTLAGGISL